MDPTEQLDAKPEEYWILDSLCVGGSIWLLTDHDQQIQSSFN